MLDLLTTVIPALLPVVSDGARAVVNRVTGGAGAQPSNVDEVIRLNESEVNRLQALAAIDSVGDTYKWVNAVRALQRPGVTAVVLGAFGAAVATGSVEIQDQIQPYVQAVTFYLFGDRTYSHFRRG